MNADRNKENFDELISKTIGRDKPQFDFDKWKQSHQKEIDIFESREKLEKTTLVTLEPNIWRIMLWNKAACLAAAFLIIFSWAACFVLSRKVTGLKAELEQSRRDIALAQQNIASAQTDDSATINLYLREHRDVVARYVSLPATPQPAQMRVNQDDILYFEFFDDGPEYMSPGIIVRGTSSQQQIGSSEAPAISNGHTLTLSEARQTAGFNLVSPSWLRPAYALDKIRRIDGRDALQLLYTDGINSVSLFEQSLDGQRGLSRQDFREYAVYRNAEQAGGTILAWRDDVRSYVLIGNIEMSQLMDMAQSISAGK
jgi:hypothetical protein